MNRTLIVAAVLVSTVAHAGDRKKAVDTTVPAAPPLTVPADAPEAVKGMAEALVGKWTGTGSVTMGADSAPMTGTWDCALGSGGYGVTCKLDAEVAGLGKLAETDLFGYDAATGLYHWFSVTNTGEVHDHAGSCDGKVTTFQVQGATDGRLFVERITFEPQADGGLRIVSVTTENGQQTARLEALMRRG
jgi:hypothetical protein